jgi:hypothetical protein
VIDGLKRFITAGKWEGARFALLWLVASVAVALLVGNEVSTPRLGGVIFGAAIAIGVYLVRSEQGP